eukprot:Em0002g1924a
MPSRASLTFACPGPERVYDITHHIEPWYDIGFYLGVKIPYLEDLKGLPSGQMSRIMRWWLGGDRHMFDYIMEPCWQTLVKAIAHPAGGDNVPLAEEIALSHLAPTDTKFIGVQYSSTVCDELTPLHEKWYDLGVKLQIDRKVLDGIKTRNNPASYLNHVVMEWLKLNSSLSCLPTWNHLIKAIALMDEEEEAKVLQQSHPVTRDITRGNTVSTIRLDVENSLIEVVDTIAKLKDQWQALGLALKLDPSVVQEVSGSTPKDCLHKVVTLWLRHDKVIPSWQELVDCLLHRLWGDNSSIIKKIIMEHPHNTAPVILEEQKEQTKWLNDEAKRLYDEAMKKGYAECSTIKCLIHGSAGVGKTHVKHLLLKMPPPELRISTGIADNPVRAVTVSAVGVSKQDEDDWYILDGDYDLMRTVSQMIKGYVLPLPKDAPREVQPVSHSSDPGPSRSSSDGYEDVLMSSPPVTSNHTHDVMVSSPDEQHIHTADTQSIVRASAPGSIQLDTTTSQISVEESFISIINQLSGNKEHLKMKWIHLVDSGGQPQFHHLLPFFVSNLSMVLFVLKLSEQFDQKRKIACYGTDGKMIGGSFESCLSHQEVMTRFLKAFQFSAMCPQVVVIGTHKDLEGKCGESNESRKEKNRKVKECLQLNKKCIPLYVGQDMAEVIFGVNSQIPDSKDRAIAKVLRTKISELSPTPENVPIAWFGLEVLLHDLAHRKKREVLSLLECKQIAERVQLKDAAFTAALNHFMQCNILLYYPDVLPDVVFCNPQVLLSIITELVQQCYKLLKQPDPTKPISGHWERFKDYAYLTQKLLDEFPGHYHDGVFSSSDVLKLFASRSIVAAVGNGEYLMPALLPECCLKDIQSDLQSGDPLLIRFKEGCYPNGVFCFLVAYLLNHSKWTVCMKDGKPKCLYSNSVAFSASEIPATITIMDTLSHFALHVVLPHGGPSPYSNIRAAIHKGIMSACKHLGYQCAEEDIIDAVYCSHGDCVGGERHHALIRGKDNDFWARCCNDESRIKKINYPWAPATSIRRCEDLECTSGHFLKIASFSFDWRRVGRRLLASQQNITDIHRDEPDEPNRREAMLMMWQSQKGSLASYSVLAETFETLGYGEIAEKVKEMERQK